MGDPLSYPDLATQSYELWDKWLVWVCPLLCHWLVSGYWRLGSVRSTCMLATLYHLPH